MDSSASNTSFVQNTTHKVVIPFYVYAALSFLVAAVLLLFSAPAFTQHYFHPRILAIVHTMALGWGTMMILGASYQLVPVLIEARLYSNALAFGSFVLAAAGIPLLVSAFFQFRFGWQAHTGAVLINAAVVLFLVNLAISISRSKSENVHAIFVLTATAWLLITTLVGLLLVLNFTRSLLPSDSLHYLSLHAHLGIVGWFLLLVIGVGSRLLPMFLISKHDDPKRLWQIYYCINGALLLFLVVFFTSVSPLWYALPLLLLLTGLLLFGGYCRKAYRLRIRRQVDQPVKISLLSIALLALPLLLLLALIGFLLVGAANTQLVLTYGFTVFFGWLTAIMLGMTFKTLPFIVWNKVYHNKAHLGKTPNPKDLFSSSVFNYMGLAYLAGFGLFTAGILCSSSLLLQVGTVFLLVTAVLYNFNTVKLLMHKPLVK